VGGVHDCCLEAAMHFYNGEGGGGNSSSISNAANCSVDEYLKDNNNASVNITTTATKSLGIPMHPV
jgi:hypothetical protein